MGVEGVGAGGRMGASDWFLTGPEAQIEEKKRPMLDQTLHSASANIRAKMTSCSKKKTKTFLKSSEMSQTGSCYTPDPPPPPPGVDEGGSPTPGLINTAALTPNTTLIFTRQKFGGGGEGVGVGGRYH